MSYKDREREDHFDSKVSFNMFVCKHMVVASKKSATQIFCLFWSRSSLRSDMAQCHFFVIFKLGFSLCKSGKSGKNMKVVSLAKLGDGLNESPTVMVGDKTTWQKY